MQSEIIKPMAGKILSTIKNQFPNHYTDNSKKEQLVKTILSKIDTYGKQINKDSAGKVAQTIIKEIINDSHTEKNKKVSYPQKPSKNTISSDYMLNPGVDHNQRMSSMSKVQFDRNALTARGRQNMVSDRPSVSIGRSNKSNYDDDYEQNNDQMNGSNYDDGYASAFAPISGNNNYDNFQEQRMGQRIDPRNTQVRQYEEDNETHNVDNRYERLMQERNQIVASSRQRPPTPEFALDGGGRKRRESQQQQSEQSQQKQKQQPLQQRQQYDNRSQNQLAKQVERQQNNFTHNPQSDFGIIGVNELAQNNDGFSSFDNIDDGFSNIDIMNTGINPSSFKYDDSVSVDQRLQQLQNDRGDMQMPQRQDQQQQQSNQQQSNQQSNQQSKQQSNGLRSIDIPNNGGLPPPLKTSVRQNRQDQEQQVQQQLPPPLKTSVRQNTQQEQFDNQEQYNNQEQYDNQEQYNNQQYDQTQQQTNKQRNRNNQQINYDSQHDGATDLYSMIDMSINQNQKIPQQIPQQKTINSVQNILNQQSPQSVRSDFMTRQDTDGQIQTQSQQSDLIKLLVQQQKMFQEEIMKLSKGMTQLQSTQETRQSTQIPSDFSPQLQLQFQSQSQSQSQSQEQVNELDQYKIINTKMQERIIDLQNQLQIANQTINQSVNEVSTNQSVGVGVGVGIGVGVTRSSSQFDNSYQSTDPKIKQLNKVKHETMEQIEKLKKAQEDISSKLTSNKELENKIKKIIIENTSKFENSEETYFINSNETSLSETVKSVTSIELTNFDLPFDKYNITINNNTLQFIISQDLMSVTNSLNTENLLENNDDSDTANIIDSDQESMIDSNFDSDSNILTLKLFMGNYSIDKIVQLLNQSLIKYKIKVSHNSNTNLITIKSNEKQNFNLLFGENSLFNNLGFVNQNLSQTQINEKYSNQHKYSGSKICDLKFDRYINIYIANINNNKPIMQYILGQQNQNKKIVFTPVISELNKLEFKFVDSKGKEFKFDLDNGLDWSMQAIVKSIVPINNVLNNELSDTLSSDDIYDLISYNVKENKSVSFESTNRQEASRQKKHKNSVQFVEN